MVLGVFWHLYGVLYWALYGVWGNSVNLNLNISADFENSNSFGNKALLSTNRHQNPWFWRISKFLGPKFEPSYLSEKYTCTLFWPVIEIWRDPKKNFSRDFTLECNIKRGRRYILSDVLLKTFSNRVIGKITFFITFSSIITIM